MNRFDFSSVSTLKIKESFFTGFILSAACFVALSLYYVFFIAQEYNYMGFVFQPSVGRLVLTWIVFIMSFMVSALLLKREPFLFSIFILLVLFFYIPNAIIFSFGNTGYDLIVSNTVFLLFFPLGGLMKFNIPQVSSFRGNNSAILILLALIPFIWILFKTGHTLNFNTLLLKEIYKTREEFSRNLSGLTNYSYHLLTKCILPVTIVLSLSEKRYFQSFVPLSMLLVLYLISGNKLVYFSSIMVLFFYFTGRGFMGKVNGFLLMLLLMLLIFPFLDFLMLDQPVLSGTFINRMLFIPALLNTFYFEFFDGRPLWFAESNLFSWFNPSPFDKPVGFVIIEHFWNEENVYGNNGIISDGFMNAGWTGVLLFSFFFSILFAFLNSLKLSPSYFGIYFSFVFIFLSAPFFSVFITGGLFLFMLIAVCCLRNPASALPDKKLAA